MTQGTKRQGFRVGRVVPMLALLLAVMVLVPGCARRGGGKSAEGGTGFEVGIWLNHATMAKGDAEIIAFLEEARLKGLTSVYPNIWFHGAVIYPGSGLVPQHPKFVGTDPLATVIREAHARNLKVHLWAEYGFFTHFHLLTAPANPGAILTAHPQWQVRDREGRPSLENKKLGVAHYSLNPAVPEARGFLRGVLLEAMRKYPDADGLHLDRIRYQSPDFSYDEFSRAEFTKLRGVDPLKIAAEDVATQQAWTAWREAQTGAFVAELAAEFRSQFPGKDLSSAVVPPYIQPEKFQRWDQWAAAGNLDRAVPMIYGDRTLVREELAKSLAMVPKGHPLTAGLDNAMGDDLAEAIDLARESGCAGVVLWDDILFRKQTQVFHRWTGRGVAGMKPAQEAEASGRTVKGKDLY